MSKYLQAIRFRVLVLTLFTVLISCTNPVDNGVTGERFTFAVADVGQGLAQFGVVGKRAVVWDVGDQYAAWRGAYVALGSPRIESIIISHTHADHCGALQSFGANFDWSGEIVVSPYEDTAMLRKSAPAWSDRITFKHCVRGDTLRTLGAAVAIICVWPPAGLNIESPIPDDQKNHYSLAFSVRHGSARSIITSDIDSAAMEEIAVHSRYDLRAQILSVPHHGSAGSVNPLFFSYVGPEVAVISCSSNNSYGHPAPKMIDELIHQAGKIMYTYTDGTVTLVSNGFYWNF